MAPLDVRYVVMLCLALDEAKAAYRVWLDVRAKRDEMLTEKQKKKPAPYRHVKVSWTTVSLSADW